MEKKNLGISFKDLTKAQLDLLKDRYIESRIRAMSEDELRKFASQVIGFQVRGTVGNAEEREVWKEMEEHFDKDFEKIIREVLKVKGAQDITTDSQQDEFKERLELLEQRKTETSRLKEDMW